MPHPPPGWYCYTAPNGSDRCATDLQGPFQSRQAVVDWLTENGIAYRPNGEAFERAVRYFGEMTGDDSHEPWATAIHERQQIV